MSANIEFNLNTIKKAAIGIVISLAAANIATSVNASHFTNADQFLTTYGKSGNWTIMHGDGDSCAADTDNAQVTMRITYTEFDQGWAIGQPYYEHINSVQAGFSFGRTPHESITLSTIQISGWAMYDFGSDNGFLNQLRRDPYIVFELDRGPQVFSLAGSSAALDMVLECARNNGKKPVQQFVQRQQRQQNLPRRQQNVQPRRSQQSNNSQSREQHYANVRGWAVNAVFGNNGFNYCAATVANRGWQMRIAHAAGKWGIGMETSRLGTMHGQLSVDYSNGRNEQAGSVVYSNDGDGWAATQLSWQFVDHLKQGSTVSLDIGDGFKRFSLSGSTAAMLKMEECARNQGVKPARRVVQTVPRHQVVQQQAPRRQFVASNFRKSVLSGIWVWDNRSLNSQRNAIISTIEITGTSSARYCYGIACWDVALQKGRNNSVTFSHDGTGFFEFWEQGPNEISANYWENGSNFPNNPDAYVTMR